MVQNQLYNHFSYGAKFKIANLNLLTAPTINLALYNLYEYIQ